MLGVPKYAGTLGNAESKLKQQISLFELVNSGKVNIVELTKFHSKFQHYLEKLQKLPMEVAVNSAHRTVLQSVNAIDIVDIDCIDTILSTEGRASKGGKKQGFQKAGSVEHNEILNQTIAHASTLSLHRDTAFTQAIKAAYTHIAICKLVFVDGYDSMYNYKDIESVELFSKYLPHCFHLDKTHKLSDDKMPFDLRNSPGSTDYIAVPKTNPDSCFPTLQDIEHCLPPQTLNLMFVKTESEQWKQYKNQSKPALSIAIPPTMSQVPAINDLIQVIQVER